MNGSLHKEGFSECINGCLVNLRYVTKIEKDTVWVDDMPLPITRRRKKAFKEDFMRFLPYAAIFLAVYFGVVRRYEGKGELKSRDMRMILLALGILFTVVIISVLVDHPMFRGDSSVLQNVFCKIYAIVCSLLAIFIAYYMSRQNRILHENEMNDALDLAS